MKLNLLPQVGAFLLACLLGTASLAQTISSDAQATINLAAELYPDLFTGGGAVQTAQGYTYLTFSSGVSVGFKDGSLFLVGGPFGADIQNRGTITAVRSSLQSLKTSVTVQPTADMNSLFTLAAQLYPTIFNGGTNFQMSADGYLYRYFADSGVYAAIKNGQVFLKGGTFGSFYTNAGTLNAVIGQLQTAVNGNTGNNGNTGQIPQGNYKLTVTGNVTIAGPISVSQPFNFVIDNVPAPDLSDQDDIKEAFVDSLANAQGITITNFSYNVVSSSANLVEYNVSVSASLSQSGVNMAYTYALNYRYTK